jgi:hypothetical protein
MYGAGRVVPEETIFRGLAMIEYQIEQNKKGNYLG